MSTTRGKSYTRCTYLSNEVNMWKAFDARGAIFMSFISGTKATIGDHDHQKEEESAVYITERERKGSETI